MTDENGTRFRVEGKVLEDRKPYLELAIGDATVMTDLEDARTIAWMILLVAADTEADAWLVRFMEMSGANRPEVVAGMLQKWRLERETARIGLSERGQR